MADENDKVLTNGSATNHSTEDEELEGIKALDDFLWIHDFATLFVCWHWNIFYILYKKQYFVD